MGLHAHKLKIVSLMRSLVLIVLLCLQEEDIYLVPAMDVDGLYSQLSHIKAVSLPRKSVRYCYMYINWSSFGGGGGGNGDEALPLPVHWRCGCGLMGWSMVYKLEGLSMICSFLSFSLFFLLPPPLNFLHTHQN